MGVLGKVVQILEQLGRAPGGLLLRELVTLTSINKSTAYRFLAQLESVGYVFRDSYGFYMVGPRLAALGAVLTCQAILARASQRALEQVWARTGETVNLAILDGHEILYLSVVASRHSCRVVSEVGTRRPLYCTALGKAILAYLCPEQQRTILSVILFERFTPQTIGSEKDLKTDLVNIRRRNYALDDEETVRGARCVAVPILNRDHKVVAGISISGPVVRVGKRDIAEFAILLQEAANEIGPRLHTFPS